MIKKRFLFIFLSALFFGGRTTLLGAEMGVVEKADSLCTLASEMASHVYYLASETLQGRFPGTQGDSLSALYVAQQMKQLGLQSFQPNSYLQSFQAQTRAGKTYATQNILGYVRGSNPELRQEWIVIGAHLDHLGYGGTGSGSRMPDTLAIHTGADDNASGVAALLGQASLLARHPLQRSVLFVAFGAEELGIQGSRFLAQRLNQLPLTGDSACFVAMINYDMVGHLRHGHLTVGGSGTSQQSDSLIQVAAKSVSLQASESPSGVGASDHTSFYAVRIPVFFLTTGGTLDYHTPRDRAETLCYAGMDSVVQFSDCLLRAIDGLTERLTFQEAGDANAQPMQARFRVTLGLMPDVTGAVKDGLRADVVVKGKPAARAGIQNGDVIVAMDGRPIHNIEEYMDCLGRLTPDTVIPVKVRRGTSVLIFSVDLTLKK